MYTHDRRMGGRQRALLLVLALALGMIPALSLSGATAAARPTATPAPSLAVTPAAGTAGITVTLTGANYTPITSTTVATTTTTYTPTVTVAFTDAAGISTTLPQTTTTDTSGAFSLRTTVPVTAAAGPATFSAVDSRGVRATGAFDVRPTTTRLDLTPSSGVPGTTVAISGSVFAANEPISLTLTDAVGAVTTVPTGTITTTATGLFTGTVVIPGNAPAGTLTVAAHDQDNNTASAPFTVTRLGAPAIGVTPDNADPNTTVTVTGTAFAANQPITLTLGQGSTATVISSNAITTSASGAFTGTATIPTTATAGTAVITATDRSGNSAATGLTIGANNGPTTLYFAEGYTGTYANNGRATFDETIALLNSNPFTATATITYLIEGATPVVVPHTIAPNSTARVSVAGDVGTNKNVAAIVGSPSRITAERIIRRVGADGTVLDANSSLGNPNLGATFYFAEGYTGISFQEYLSLANPGNTDAHVTVRFAPQAASAAGAPSETFIVPAKSRVTRNIRRDTLSLSNKSVGMIVVSDQPIMAERVLYFGDGAGSAKYGSTAKAGIQTVGNQYIFAYGSAGGSGLAQQAGDQSYVTVLNPGTSPISATVVAQFYDAAGKSLGSATLAVAPGTRQTLFANTVVKDTGSIYSTVLTSASPFVAEKPQYYGGSPNAGSHPGVAPSGAPAGVKSAAFPDLSLVNSLGGPQQQTIFLYNPGTTPITVTGTYYGSNGSKAVVYTVNPNNIATVNVNTDASSVVSTAGTSAPAGVLGATFVVTSGGASDSFVATNIGNSADGRSYTGTQGALPAQ